jgi:hypothetical protein
MPVMKYSEILLAAAFAILAITAWLVQTPPVQTPRNGASAAAGVQPMIVVVITGKRMTPEQKRLTAASD